MTDTQVDAQEAKLKEVQAKADATNSSRTGVGTRVKVGQTRGRNPQVITFEFFDETKVDTLPKSIDEFTKIAGVADEAALLSMCIDGYNQQSYTNASDPIAEFVEPGWDSETIKQFRTVIRNFVGATNGKVNVEEAVNLIKPGIVAALAAK